MKTAHTLLTSLLGGWYLDTDFLIQLIDDYDLELDPVDTLESYGVTLPCSREARFSGFPINCLIHTALGQIAEQFLTDRRDDIVAEIRTYEPSYELTDASFEYDTFVNYLDSSVWFTDLGMQTEFDEWRDRRV